MASDTSVIFYGIGHLVGDTVSVAVGGLDCGDFVVASDGSVTVPFGGDAQGIFTPAYLVAVSGSAGPQDTSITFIYNDAVVTAETPVVIGLAYRSQGQTLRPALADDLGIRLANGMGKLRRSHQFAALFHYTVVMTVGTDFDGTMDPIALVQKDGETAWPTNTVYTGVYRAVLTDEYSYDSMLCWQINRPVPAMVCAVSAFLEAEKQGS